MKPKTMASALPSARTTRFFSAVVQASLSKSRSYCGPASRIDGVVGEAAAAGERHVDRPADRADEGRPGVTASAGVNASCGATLLHRIAIRFLPVRRTYSDLNAVCVHLNYTSGDEASQRRRRAARARTHKRSWPGRLCARSSRPTKRASARGVPAARQAEALLGRAVRRSARARRRRGLRSPGARNSRARARAGALRACPRAGRRARICRRPNPRGAGGEVARRSDRRLHAAGHVYTSAVDARGDQTLSGHPQEHPREPRRLSGKEQDRSVRREAKVNMGPWGRRRSCVSGQEEQLAGDRLKLDLGVASRVGGLGDDAGQRVGGVAGNREAVRADRKARGSGG